MRSVYCNVFSYSYLLFRKLYPQIKSEDTPIMRNSVFPQPAVAVDKSWPCEGEREGERKGRRGERERREKIQQINQ